MLVGCVTKGFSLPEGATFFLHCWEMLRFSFIAGRRFAFPAYVFCITEGLCFSWVRVCRLSLF